VYDIARGSEQLSSSAAVCAAERRRGMRQYGAVCGSVAAVAVSGSVAAVAVSGSVAAVAVSGRSG
jgi:hypothetical protein